ncbi:AfsR/SARP family transcriptional regulator [Micromonospora aurantiaca (nom. illeg.)]|uniref:AfsR/SARP family transcriptional regulator n=1 Tax=Micromonospora aurantiaca (nom. illeg.) TaxID=47850 RepID=UPI0008291853|nr:BTAD domain-containing putative transcriptional regulator [Micromonospora aurantiaca]SCL40518.1 DNA-binding transcriptional activator of the SARP family [Micromonospora aurantiaca]
MRFGILGPLRVGGGEATVTAGRDRTVLAMLLLRPGRVVPVEDLVDAVWEERPPATARTQLQICVSRLRQRFAALGLPAGTIVTDPAGYGIRIEPDDLDADMFARAVETARAEAAAGRFAEARRHYRAALALWRGPALAGIPARLVRLRAQALDEQRLAVLEDCVDVELRLRRGTELVDELTEAVEHNPLRERLRGQLMLALSAVGRQADALAVYREGRRIYAEELGIEPGAALQELHQRVLGGDLVLGVPESRVTAPVRALPRAISDFTGRQQTVARLVKEVAEEGSRVQLLDGMAGSGKTTLAVQVASALVDRFPDAQLFVDLHGHSDRSPLSTAAAAAILLQQLGVPAERVPADLAGRLAMWRSELADRRAVVVLDNAADAAQVVPLLPNGRDCTVLITSRRRLVGVDAGRPTSLPVLDADEAVELLARVAGAERVDAEPEAAAEVARRCGHLPLALRLAGARLAHRPRWRMADLAERLAGAADPLAELTVGERSVARAFALSYEQVPPVVQRVFRLLGLHPGSRIDNRVAAVLAELPLSEAQDALDELVDAHLVEEVEPGRYRLHDLIREYAHTLGAERETGDERRAAIARLLDHHLHVAAAIALTLEQTAPHGIFARSEPVRPDLVAATVVLGRPWLEENRSTLTALVRLAEAEGFLRQSWQLARVGWTVNFYGGHLDDLIETHQIGLRAAERLGDDEAVATMHNYLASADYRRARFAEVIRRMEVVVGIYRRLDRPVELRKALDNLGTAYAVDGHHRQAIEMYDASAALARRLDDPFALTNMLNNLSLCLMWSGRYDEALRKCRHHLALARQVGDPRQLGNAVGHLGMVRHRRGERGPARRLLRTGLTLKRKIGNRYGEGELLNELGMMEREEGRPEQAAALHREALMAMNDAGDLGGQCASRNLLARAMLDQGDVASALDLHRRVLTDATRLSARYEQACALDGMARCLRHTDPDQARRYAGRALALFRQVESPDRRETERLLAELG